MEKYLNSQRLLDQFTEFASANGVKKDRDGLIKSGEKIHIELKAYTARNILDNKGFYPIWGKNDKTLKYAIDFIGKQE
jgi:carboxyl-terminal processing protease